MAPHKALKVTPGSTAHWVAGAQTAIRRGATSVRAGLTESVPQGGAAKATPTPTGDGAPPPHEGEGHESDGAEVSSVAEATEVEALGVSKAEATAKAVAAEVEAPMTIKAMMAGAGAPGTTGAGIVAVRPSAQEVEMKAVEASVAPLVQGPPLLWESESSSLVLVN